MCSAVTCHPHFRQSDRDLPLATAAVERYRNKNEQHRKLTLEKKFTSRSCRDSNPRFFGSVSGALTTELSLFTSDVRSFIVVNCFVLELQRNKKMPFHKIVINHSRSPRPAMTFNVLYLAGTGTMLLYVHRSEVAY